MESQFVWTDTQGDSGDIDTIDGNAYLTLDMASTRPKAAAVCHSLDFGTAQALAFHLAVAPAHPEPQPGEFWWVRVDGRDSVGMIYASGSGLRVRCQFIAGSQVVTNDGPLEQCTLIGRVPFAQKGE